MQPLATIRRVMTWLSMCPADEPSNAWQKVAYVASALTMLFLDLFGFVTCLMYCFEFISVDFNGAMFAFMIGSGEFALIYILVAAISMRHQIGRIFTSLSKIYKSNENGVEFRYLTQANNTSEWMPPFFLKYITITLGVVLASALLSVLYSYLTQEDFNVDQFHRPGNFVFPWNQATIIGYYGELFASILIGYGYMITNGTPMLLFISLCLHHQAFLKMFEHSIDNSVQCDAKLLCDLIRFHISAKDFFLKSADVYSPFVLVQLSCGTVWMTVSIFYLDLQLKQFDLTMASVMASTSVGMTNLFLYCYFGKLATESYEAMSDCVFDMNWFEQPIGLQKYFILMIVNMQKPVYYHGFKVAIMDLQTFVQLFRKVFSFYVAMKAVASK